MFGIIMAVMSTGRALVGGIQHGVEEAWAIDRAKQRNDGTNTYFDWRGQRRDLTTHEVRSVDFAAVEADGQDRCIRDVHGNVVRNFTEEEAEERRKEALRMGRTVYLYRKHGNGIYNGSEHRDKGGDGWCEGTQFKDMMTGEIYVARIHCVCGIKELGKDAKWDDNMVTFYMSLDGRLIRETDSVMFKRRRGEVVPSKEIVEEYIKTYNQRKKPIPSCDAFGKPIYNDIIYQSEIKKYYDDKYAITSDV